MTNNKSLRSRHCIMLKLQIDTKHRAASLRQQSYLLVVTAIWQTTTLSAVQRLCKWALFTSDKGRGTCFCSCLSVCLSVWQQDYSKTRAWIWVKFCVSTNVGTCTNWLTFEPDPDHSPDAGTGLLSAISYRLRNFAALPRLTAGCAATQNLTSGKSHVYVLAARR